MLIKVLCMLSKLPPAVCLKGVGGGGGGATGLLNKGGGSNRLPGLVTKQQAVEFPQVLTSNYYLASPSKFTAFFALFPGPSTTSLNPVTLPKSHFQFHSQTKEKCTTTTLPRRAWESGSHGKTPCWTCPRYPRMLSLTLL